MLTEARERTGPTQLAVSAKLKRPANFCSLVENGQRMLNSSEFMAYAAALGKRPSRIMAAADRRLNWK